MAFAKEKVKKKIKSVSSSTVPAPPHPAEAAVSVPAVPVPPMQDVPPPPQPPAPVPMPVMVDPKVTGEVIPPGQPRRPLRPNMRGQHPELPGNRAGLPQGAHRVLPQNPPPPVQAVPPPLPVPQQPELVKVSPNAGVFSFTNDTHFFGLIPEGNPVEWDFDFKNTGKEAIVIKEAHASCGCTIPSYPKEPIQPGASGKIHVIYNTKGRPGVFNKDVTITSNARQQPMVLHISGEVITQ